MPLLHSLPIESVDLEAQGLAHHDGKVVFVENALLGEVVDVEVTRNKPSYAKGRAVAWQRESAQRVDPKCRHYGVCGGCSMQHIDHAAQLAIKQRVLEDNLWHIGRLRPESLLPPLDGPSWGYRTRARLTARWVDKKGGIGREIFIVAGRFYLGGDGWLPGEDLAWGIAGFFIESK